MRWTMGWTAVALLAVAASPAGAQERRVEEMDLPRHVADEIIDFFNSPSTIRFRGRAEIPAGRMVVGDVAVLGGPFRVAGEVQGNVVVVNGNLVVPDGGRILGNATVLGGSALAGPNGVSGQLTVYDEPLAYAREGEGIAFDERPWRPWRRRDRSGSYISARTEGNYNRVEGLPVLFGPVFRTAGPHHLRADAMAVWRSEAGVRLNEDALGYVLRAEQHLGPDGHFSIGASAHSLVEPIEDRGLKNIEVSLAAFLFHQDYRDYYERQGFAVFGRFDDPDRGIRLTAEYRDEDHLYAPVGSPWTLTRNEAPWRPQPLVAEGRLRRLVGEIVLDRRNDPDDPSDGWHLVTRATTGVGGNLTLPGYFQAAPQPPDPVVEPVALGSGFRAGVVDLRRYARLGPGAALKLRGMVAGSLDGDPLPPQMQHALGGEGSLPGYKPMSIDCGARTQTYSVFRGGEDHTARTPAFAGYGCDRVALFQVEYRGDLSFNFDLGPDDEWNEEWSWYPVIDFTPSWSVFFDAGRGWSFADGDLASLWHDTETFTDVGFGLLLGDLGLYWAWPLKGEDQGLNFFIRIDHRF